ncbi:MAG: alcohol dehydrogenase [Chloroflexi bacterium AL-W]|nr:alcohol dehydrogenase [Chloroflexi bacterium AL-N1]NOK70249.1 alcohol dehydrogenase [Chloroflexi bacterium AL-N10]NOK77786.1 alcohol dehydrogenase [Chloroflexi bacterium AL-N5]NOK84795.1 alcohol dehydrogenase [Chloroflexi bacterium AL-W]NOK92402.1 alcohol dehydrogenase [Chloroflexi bacterium AL-N15]
MQMTQALVIAEPHNVELRPVNLIEPGDDDVVVRTSHTSISAGTERMLLSGRMPHPMLQFPVVPGYETVGQVVHCGAHVPADLAGSWVYVGGALCFEGVNPAWGGQSQTLVVDHRRVVPLAGIAPQQGVLLALSATALHGIDLLQLRPEQRVLVLGQGPVGQLAARLAVGQERWVAVADRVASRLERSVADVIFDVRNTSLTDQLNESVDVIIESTGSMQALSAALALLSEGGTILLLGYYDELHLPYMPLFLKQARLLTAREWGPGDLAECRDRLLDGSLNVESLITHQIPVERFKEAYHTALEDPECLKLVLEWSQS